MNVFFEDSGSFKAGTVLSHQNETLQVELPGGRRIKVKSKDVLLEFSAPTAAELMRAAEACAQAIELDFLWECAGSDEFNFAALAVEYFGAQVTSIERASLVLRLHGAPVYFRRKGRGQYLRAPEEQLKAALAALERRSQQAALQATYEAELTAHRLPAAFEGKVLTLLTKPDKNSIEYKALEAAASVCGVSVAQLILDCGAIPSARALHESRFLAEHFPQGTGFGPAVEYSGPAAESGFDELPVTEVQAFSIDDISTTEIDDAFSVEWLANDRLRIGVHIAAPALGVARDDMIDLIARTRLSTVYVPGDKITMLPAALINTFTLKEGGLRPVLSFYAIIDGATQDIVATETRAERVFIAHNLRHNWLDAIVTAEAIAAGEGDYPYKKEIAVLWPFAQALYEKRQTARINYGLKRETQRYTDFNFAIDGESVSITPRRRGSPLDLIVAELAILVNSSWGAVLAKYDVPGIYRAQRSFGVNRTRMQIGPEPHEGLGVEQYAWSTSPLRRYIDLVNQWQLLACTQHGVAAKLVAPFKPKDADLYVIVQNFDEIYQAYADHQNRMERFWCLRWLKQEKRERMLATVLKGDLVRFDEIPLLLHVPGLGVHARDTKLWLDILALDELTLEVSCRLAQVLEGSEAQTDLSGDTALSCP
ncbi:ribonuclease catalytic domain-containing protein [Mycoavidus sp. B2-EB]|uniref:ribonuclease catalytic domain-containing protein n=1 Tax=Mycoavidus sp. B2-EB TaxID=2651972 RepID=UPI001629A051|nr:RNB domain-containing ribonuclease [Mycoavidus sp. B2-EB]BBO60140.1 exoribonuclease II [Mycoavidus sp. B2-EB]